MTDVVLMNIAMHTREDPMIIVYDMVRFWGLNKKKSNFLRNNLSLYKQLIEKKL
jgi:hypothetical protein